MEQYRETARRRAAADRAALAARYERAWAVAEQAAVLLKEEFRASKVAVFGSLVHPDLFHSRSDVDLAVWGLDERDYYRAVSRLIGLDSEFSVDLVEADQASARLRERIEREGQQL